MHTHTPTAVSHTVSHKQWHIDLLPRRVEPFPCANVVVVLMGRRQNLRTQATINNTDPWSLVNIHAQLRTHVSDGSTILPHPQALVMAVTAPEAESRPPRALAGSRPHPARTDRGGSPPSSALTAAAVGAAGAAAARARTSAAAGACATRLPCGVAWQGQRDGTDCRRIAQSVE